MKNQFIEEMLENLQIKVDDLLDEVETMNNSKPTKAGESIEDQIQDIKEDRKSTRLNSSHT